MRLQPFHCSSIAVSSNWQFNGINLGVRRTSYICRKYLAAEVGLSHSCVQHQLRITRTCVAQATRRFEGAQQIPL